MKFLSNLILLLIFCVFLQQLLYEPERQEPMTPYVNPTPEPFREVHHFDWENNRYVYKDEIPPDTVKRKAEPLTAKPDSYVEVVNGGHVIRDDYRHDPQVIINGVRYRQQRLANGDIKLIQIR